MHCGEGRRVGKALHSCGPTRRRLKHLPLPHFAPWQVTLDCCGHVAIMLPGFRCLGLPGFREHVSTGLRERVQNQNQNRLHMPNQNQN